MLLRLIIGVACWAALAPAPCAAQADGGACGGPPPAEPLESTPANGAIGVTLDAPLILRFDAPLGQADPAELVSLQLAPCAPGESVGCCAGDAADCEVPGRFELFPEQPRALVFQPLALLAPDAEYEAQVRTLVGEPRTVRFRTGDRVDAGPPLVARGDLYVSAASGGGCGGARIDVVFGSADDDGPLGSLRYHVFQTAGVGLDAPRLRRSVTAPAAREDVQVSFLIDAEQVQEPVCVAVQVVDGVGHVVDYGGQQCVDPFSEIYFDSLCSAAAGRRGGGALPAWVLAAALLWLARRGRRCA